jgi:predicted O-methyltransferase YrrM
MATIRNVFACLVHENQDCVIDLVRNLRALDPLSLILLYNGGRNPNLLTTHIPFERQGAVVHPSPRPVEWGHLHNFALDCMKWACENYLFDTLTIVDSDQLAIRTGYSEFLAPRLKAASTVGILGNSSLVQLPGTNVGPAASALHEIELWRPFLRTFPDGERKFVHWCFWPSTVFTADAARDLVRLFATSDDLQNIMQQTQIWATEEVILPTLVALLGYEVVLNPCSYDLVQYRVPFTVAQIEAGLNRQDIFWIHPVPRHYDDPLRRYLREKWNHYQLTQPNSTAALTKENTTIPQLLLTIPVLERMRRIEGWLEDAEADLLLAAVTHAVATVQNGAIVEIGSYCGRSTVVLAAAVRALEDFGRIKIYAIDPHDGIVGALDQGVQQLAPTRDQFLKNISNAGITHLVEPLFQQVVEIDWNQPISFLLIDGLHDYFNVARDFYHFERWIAPDGFIAFHDYADYYPGVKAFVNELLANGGYEKICQALSMIVIRGRRGMRAADPSSKAAPDINGGGGALGQVLGTIPRSPQF